MSPRGAKRPRLPQPPKRRREDQVEGPAGEWSAREAGDRQPSGVEQGGRTNASLTEALGDWRETLEGKLRLLPRQSGVYLFRDGRGRVLYVGKAKRLHLRVRSYFRGPLPLDSRLRGLRRRIRSLDWVVTSGEAEALILEDSLIKQYAPRFNIRLKDDKRYPYVKVTTGHPFPGIFLTRTVSQDGSRYFGPFTRVRDLREILRVLRQVFRLRNCSDRRLAQGGRECLQYFIGRCTAPCTQRVSREEYAEQVRPMLELLEGRGEEAARRMRQRMLAAAEELRFEESARLRDEIENLRALMQDRGLAPPVETEADVVGVAARGDMACGVFLHLRDGSVAGKHHHLLTGVEGANQAALLRALLPAALLNAPRVPRRLVTSIAPRDAAEIETALSARSGHPVQIQAGSRSFAHFLQMAAQNAHLLLEEEQLKEANKQKRVDRSVYALQEALTLSAPPYRIEGYDISNTQAAYPVASQVVFRDGKAWKSGYRRYKMSGAPGPDDFAMIGEVLRRRLERLRREAKLPPDLILVDGGQGQVARAAQVMEELGFGDVPLIGLAKREEEIVRPNTEQSLRLPANSEALRLLQRVRDEAHRFANRYHRGLRQRGQKASRLDQVAGIGPARRRILLRRFGSIEGIRKAGPEELAKVPGIGPALAQSLWEAIRGPDGERERQNGARIDAGPEAGKA